MRRNSGFTFRIIIGLVLAGVAYFSYLGKSQENPLTGEVQKVSLSPEEEVALGLQSAPQMAQEYGGLYPDEQVQKQVSGVGNRLVQAFNRELDNKGIKNPYVFNFYVLRDGKTVNAFALPGGQIFITAGLLGRLKTEDQLAGVLGHEIAHVIHRHSSEQMAKTELYQGLAGAASASAGDLGAGQIASYVANMKLLKYGREDELESDEFGVKYMINAGYHPEAMIEVMQILAEASGGDMDRDEFSSSHPSPANRISRLKELIAAYKNNPQ
ncbi:M48 family metalloprotease [Leadbetterella byssophila]|jgi:predicted Zn-dependent protease|uniref:Peptidase M48 Ste24p n=1 Tax=Leadbetterella byssophila (strain DSM 17132 / JCM 16389 / KACC 11308 / NBRC 106382 / 4M15) TaxID=649349 RepID=E4RVQ8_LEAB4|nr:M48 family metalloprotease [Leadbetterella byssophila]ADQ17957.1 peptidase M48 Ste24p [Leadbetterella byssophila DSM 17132]